MPPWDTGVVQRWRLFAPVRYQQWERAYKARLDGMLLTEIAKFEDVDAQTVRRWLYFVARSLTAYALYKENGDAQ